MIWAVAFRCQILVWFFSRTFILYLFQLEWKISFLHCYSETTYLFSLHLQCHNNNIKKDNGNNRISFVFNILTFCALCVPQIVTKRYAKVCYIQIFGHHKTGRSCFCHCICCFQNELAKKFFNDGRSFDLEGEKVRVEMALWCPLPVDCFR